MSFLTVNLKRNLTALGLSLLLASTAAAERAPADLMSRLAEAEGAEAARLAAEVKQHWARSGSATVDLLLKRGREAMEKEEFALAIDHLTALTDHAPRFAEGYHARAQAFYRADLYGPAVDDLEMVLALNPDHFDAIFGLGVVFQQTGDSRRAALLYRKTLALYPAHEDAGKALAALKREGIGREL